MSWSRQSFIFVADLNRDSNRAMRGEGLTKLSESFFCPLPSLSETVYRHAAAQRQF